MARACTTPSPCRYPLDLLPGWTAESVGYHTGDGKLYKGRPRGQPFGPRCEAGDRVGCGVKYEVVPRTQACMPVWCQYSSLRMGRSWAHS